MQDMERLYKHLTNANFVVDLDYCAMDEMECPELSRCQRLGAANYSCVCDAGLRMIVKDLKHMCVPVEEQTQDGHVESNKARTSQDGYIHVILSADVEHWKGSVTI